GRHPVVISGPWDFAGLLLGLSGFLIFGGPAALTGLYEQWRMSWLLGQTRFLAGTGAQWEVLVGLLSAYFALGVGGAAILLYRRRSETSIYNIDTAAFGTLLQQVLDRMGLNSILLAPQRILVHPRESPQQNWPEAGSILHHPPSMELEWEMFPVM